MLIIFVFFHPKLKVECSRLPDPIRQGDASRVKRFPVHMSSDQSDHHTASSGSEVSIGAWGQSGGGIGEGSPSVRVYP